MEGINLCPVGVKRMHCSRDIGCSYPPHEVTDMPAAGAPAARPPGRERNYGMHVDISPSSLSTIFSPGFCRRP